MAKEENSWLQPNHAAIHGNAFRRDAERKALIGREARTITSLRPTGEVRVAGRYLDAVADGGFIEAGEKVRIKSTRDFRVVVVRVA